MGGEDMGGEDMGGEGGFMKRVSYKRGGINKEIKVT